MWKPMHQQPVYRDCRYVSHTEGEDVARRLFATGLCLPSGSNMPEEDQERVVAAFRECLTR